MWLEYRRVGIKTVALVGVGKYVIDLFLIRK